MPIEILVAAIYAAYVLSGFVGVAISVRKGQIPADAAPLGFAFSFLIGTAVLWIALRD